MECLVSSSNFLDQGVERIVDQVVNPKISSVFVPQVEEIFYKYLGLEKPDRTQKLSDWSNNLSSQLDSTADNLLPNDLESVSPESVKSYDNKHVDTSYEEVKTPLNVSVSETIKEEDQEVKLENQSEDSVNSNDEEFESPAFEPLEPAIKEEGCSKDSHLSGISDLTSHDSNISSNANDTKTANITVNKSDAQNNSELSQVSSDSNLSEGRRTPSDLQHKNEINFQNKFSNIKPCESTDICDENKDSVNDNQTKYHKFEDDNSVDARECFEEANDYEMLDINKSSNAMRCDNKTDEIDNENKNLTDNFEMAKCTRSSGEVAIQRHRDSVESKTSTESIKGMGSMEMSLDSNESNSVFVHNVKNESENEKESISFENSINPVISNTDYQNDSSNGSKNDSVKDFVSSEAAESYNKSKELIKNKDSESKQSSVKDVKERDRHSSSSSARDKDRKDDSRHHSRSSHSRHSSGRRDSERRHSSSHDKKEHGSSKSSSRDKYSKSGSTSESKRDKHGSSSHRSSHKSSRHSDHKHSSSDKSNSHESRNHKYKSRDSSSKSDFKVENNKDKNGTNESNSHSKNSDKRSDHSGKYSHHSSHRDKSNSKYSRTDKNTKSNGSNSSDDKKSDEKKNKKPKEENCSSSSKQNRTRRSTDRDSNDGSGSSTKTSGTHKNPSSNNHSATQKSKSSNSDNNSNSNYSGQSDTLKTDMVNITSGKYIKSEFNMFEFGSMNAIKRHNLNEKTAQAAKIIDGNKSVENDIDIKSPDTSSSSPIHLNTIDKLSPVKSPEIPNKKPVIHIDSQLQPDKTDELIYNQDIRCEVLKKPKCASNIYEAMKVMKIRKRMDKMEQKRKQEAIMLMEKQNNVPKGASQVYSGISGPEVVLTCMKQEDIDSYSSISIAQTKKSDSEPAIKFCDNKYDSQTMARMKHLEQYILKLERECVKFEAAKKQGTADLLQQSSTNVQSKNGLISRKQINNQKTKKYLHSLSKADNSVNMTNVNFMSDEVQEDLCNENFNQSFSEQNSSFVNETKDNEYYEKMDLILNDQSQKDIFEIILGSEASFDTTTVSFSGELLNNVSENTKEKSHNAEIDEAAMKPLKVNRKRPSTSVYNNERNFENNSKLNHNNNELCSEKRRKVLKKTPLLEKGN